MSARPQAFIGLKSHQAGTNHEEKEDYEKYAQRQHRYVFIIICWGRYVMGGIRHLSVTKAQLWGEKSQKRMLRKFPTIIISTIIIIMCGYVPIGV